MGSVCFNQSWLDGCFSSDHLLWNHDGGLLKWLWIWSKVLWGIHVTWVSRVFSLVVKSIFLSSVWNPTRAYDLVWWRVAPWQRNPWICMQKWAGTLDVLSHSLALEPSNKPKHAWTNMLQTERVTADSDDNCNLWTSKTLWKTKRRNKPPHIVVCQQ